MILRVGGELMKRLRFVAVLCCFLFCSVEGSVASESTLYVSNGVLDLRGLSFNNETTYRLVGQWGFYWRQLKPGIEGDHEHIWNSTSQVPGSWTRTKDTDGALLPAFSFATYRLKILADSSLTDTKISILFPRILQSCAIYTKHPEEDQARLIGARGNVSPSPGTFSPDARMIKVDFQLAEETLLYVQVANFFDPNNSGVAQAPILGLPPAVYDYSLFQRQKDFAIIGAILTVAVFMLSLFVLHRSDKGPLWLAVFCFIVAIRILSLNRYLNEFFPNMELLVVFHKINYLTMSLMVPAYIAFLISMFPAYFKTRVNWVFIGISLVYSFVIVISPVRSFSVFLNPFMVFILVVFLYTLSGYLRSFFTQFNWIILLAFLGTMSIIVFGAAEIMVRMWMHLELNSVPYGLLVNILFMGFIVSFSNSLARQHSEHLAETLTEEVGHRKSVEAELNRVNQNLEHLVEERTRDLKGATQQLVENAHKAGMAEIAANTLHNVGNVLNSLTTSAIIIHESAKQSPIDSYHRANDMMREHLHDFADFVKNDPKGEKLLRYYLELEKGFDHCISTILTNSERLKDKANVITEIITSQKHMVGSALLVETVALKDVIETSLDMLPSSFYNEEINLVKSYHEIPRITVQKSKLVHILVNLLNNAFQAMNHPNINHKQISIEINSNEEQAWITISDTGIGIPAENLDKIFLHGFTTKDTGHGFGLHSSAIYMQEMGGKIVADSKGTGKGSTFSLIFPLDEEPAHS